MFRQKTLVPAYIYPSWNGSDWDKIITAGERCIAVMNPNSGPGTASNSDYVAVVTRAKAAGVKIIGYVDTNYGARATSDVEADIDKYNAWYGVDGIFFDRVASDVTHLVYYTTLSAYVKTDAEALVVLNHGTIPTEHGYANICDVDVIFENTEAVWKMTIPLPSWVLALPQDRVAVIIHTVSPATDMPTLCQQAAQNNAGVIYCTDQVMPNPYGALPRFWSDFVTYHR